MNRFKHQAGAIALTSLLCVGIGVAVPGTASANHEGTPSTRELLQLCNDGRADRCDFRPSGGINVYYGPRSLAGSGTNCTNFNQVRVIRYEASQYTSHSFGVELSAGSKIGKAFEWSISTSYSRKWAWTDSKADEVRQDIGPRSRVIVYVAKQRSQVRGTYEIHFGNRYKGHYYWYASGQVEGQTEGQPWDIATEQVRVSC